MTSPAVESAAVEIERDQGPTAPGHGEVAPAGPDPIARWVRSPLLQRREGVLRRQYLDPCRPTEVPAHRGPCDIDLLDRYGGDDFGQARAQVGQIGRARRPTDPHHARAIRSEPEGEWRPFRPMADDILTAPEHPDAVLQRYGESLGPRGSRTAPFPSESAAIGQWGRRLVRRAGTNWHRARRRPVPPRSSAA